MTEPTDELIAAIGNADTGPVAAGTLDIGNAGDPTDIGDYLTSVTVTSSLTTDLPDGARLVSGYSAGSLAATLGGEKYDNEQDGGWLWSPFNTDSPYYGQQRIAAPITIGLGYDTGTKSDPNPETMPAFTGNLTDLDVDLGARTASMPAIDPSDRMRAQILLPMYTNLGHPGLSGRTFIDYILEQNGIDLADCDLEPSLNPLTATPWTSTKAESWTLIQQIAAAELATAFYDGAGKFHFWNREHFTRQRVDYDAMTVTTPSGETRPIDTISTDRGIAGLVSNESVSTIINHVIVNFQPLVVQPFDWIWQETAPRGIHSKGSISILASFDNPVQSIGTTVEVIPIGGDTGSNSGYRANTKQDGTGRAVENLTFTITPFASAARIDIHNPNPFVVWLVEPRNSLAGHLYPGWSADTPRPMLWLRGRQVVANPSYTTTTDGSTGASMEALDQKSIDDHGEQPYTLDAGGWLQDPDTAQALAKWLGALMKRPVPQLSDIVVPGDPRRRLGDRTVVQDTTGSQLDEHVWITGKVDTFDGTTYTQTLSIRLCAAIGGWVLGHPTRSILGETTVLGGVY